MQLEDSKRSSFFEKARSISPTFGYLFQNPMYITTGMIDLEFDSIQEFEHELNTYKDSLVKLQEEIGESPS